MNRALLEALADGRFHSGEQLGVQLGVSRTAIWKHLAAFKSLGIELESRKGKGYRIVGGIELLDTDRIRAALSDAARNRLRHLELLDQVDSTNRRALDMAAAAGSGGFVCLAEMQHAGRGRRGRPWISPYGRNVYLSLIWEFQGGAAGLEGLSLAVAVAIARALHTRGIRATRLKWPNDLLLNGGKLGGILIELAGDLSGPCRAVIGVGLNLGMPSGAAAQIDQSWSDLQEAQPAQAVSRNALIGTILSELVGVLERFAESGFAPFRQEWESLDSLRGQAVSVRLGEREISGRADGVNEHGALRLQTARGVQCFIGGEVSLRAQQ